VRGPTVALQILGNANMRDPASRPPGTPTYTIGQDRTVDQARAVLTHTKPDPLHCYVVGSLLTRARTDELRAMR
jgi:hypothetical protein